MREICITIIILWVVMRITLYLVRRHKAKGKKQITTTASDGSVWEILPPEPRF